MCTQKVIDTFVSSCAAFCGDRSAAGRPLPMCGGHAYAPKKSRFSHGSSPLGETKCAKTPLWTTSHHASTAPPAVAPMLAATAAAPICTCACARAHLQRHQPHARWQSSRSHSCARTVGSNDGGRQQPLSRTRHDVHDHSKRDSSPRWPDAPPSILTEGDGWSRDSPRPKRTDRHEYVVSSESRAVGRSRNVRETERSPS